jgi:hypothetical protein
MENIFSKAYNQLWVENIHNQSVIKKWFYQKKINDAQFEAAKKEFPIGFKHSNIFVKIGLFIFANILLFSAAGFVSLFFAALFDNSITVGILSLMYGIILFVVLNNLIPKNNFYRSGVDNAILYAMLSCFFGFFLAVTDFKLPTSLYTLILIGLLTLALLKYADLMVTICLYGSWIFLWFNVSSKFPIGKLILPFVIMIISAFSYFLVKYWRKKEGTNYYTDSQNILEILALITFYIGGNYYVVREGNALLNSLDVSTQIAFAPLFYFFTVGIPLFYIIMGLKRHDRKVLIVGLLTVGFSIYTYREYFTTLPVEWALTLGGISVILVSIFVIRYLKVPKHSLTYVPDSENKLQNFEAVLVNQIMPTASTPDGTKFGGGDFGGAGASGEY